MSNRNVDLIDAHEPHGWTCAETSKDSGIQFCLMECNCGWFGWVNSSFITPTLMIGPFRGGSVEAVDIDNQWPTMFTSGVLPEGSAVESAAVANAGDFDANVGNVYATEA